MTTLHDILTAHNSKRHATEAGANMHIRLRRIVLDKDEVCGDTDLVKRIGQKPEVAKFFCKAAKTEVPIAGTINNRFISRRIDRIVIDSDKNTIQILDYKTDINPDTFRAAYIAQIREYVQLMRAIYPDYVIEGYILWTHDFLLEKIPTEPL